MTAGRDNSRDILRARQAWLAGAVLGTIAAAGLAVHFWFALGADALDADRALVLLMARHFAQGEWALFFWQQNYMVALESYLLAPFAAAGLATPFVASCVAIALTVVTALFSVRLATRAGGLGWLAALLWALPPALVVHHHVSLYGARLAATLLALAAFIAGARAASRRGWVGVGALIGVAYFSDHLMLGWGAAVVYVAARRGALGPLVLGAAPVACIDALSAALTPAVHLAGPNYPADWLATLPLLAGRIIPQLAGMLLGRGPGPDWEPAPNLVPATAWWPVVAGIGAAVMLALAWTLIRRNPSSTDDGGTSRPATRSSDPALTLRALGVATAVQLALFVMIGGGGEKWSVRYLVPLWPALSVGVAVAAAHWPARLRPLAALVILPALLTLSADNAWPRAGDARPAREEAEQVERVVRQHGVGAVWADYWDAYRFALLTGDQPRWVTYRVIERRPDWVRDAREATAVAYLVRQGDAQVLAAVDSARRGGLSLRADTTVGRFRLIVVDRAIPAVEFRNAPPSRRRQAVAAVSGALLLLGLALSLGPLLARAHR